MEVHEYQTLYHFETFYWWYKGLHGILLDQLRSLKLANHAAILDAGCGTGKNLSNIQQNVTDKAFGFDFSAHAGGFWKDRELQHVCLASINQIPFADASFDAVMSIDVLESDAVNDVSACAELWRVTKVGGYILLVVPAYKWLLTEEHHRAVHASRRYSRHDAVALMRQSPVAVVRSSHLFAFLFPAIAAYRLLLQRRTVHNAFPRSELKPLPRPINELLTLITGLEGHLLRFVNLPFGSSILVVARKVAA